MMMMMFTRPCPARVPPVSGKQKHHINRRHKPCPLRMVMKMMVMRVTAMTLMLMLLMMMTIMLNV